MSKSLRMLLVVIFILAWSGSASAGPITDTVTVDGRNWAQVDLFTNLSWVDIKAACPGGVCGSATLNGFDMSGWSWASIGDLNALFNHYLSGAGITGGDLLDSAAPDRLYDFSATAWAPAFFADGWRSIYCDCALIETGGWTSELDSTGLFANIGDVTWGVPAGSFDNVSTEARFGAQGFRSSRIGSWFYQPGSAVPVPGTALLLGLGVAVLGVFCREFGGVR